eukprot:138438-Pleurochrysis_carterae.AAC.1
MRCTWRQELASLIYSCRLSAAVAKNGAGRSSRTRWVSAAEDKTERELEDKVGSSEGRRRA